MKRIIVFMICISLLMSGCGVTHAETENPVIESEPTIAETETMDPVVSSSEFILGNISFSIPDGFFVYSELNGSYFLTSDDRKCDISLYAFNCSILSEDMMKSVLADQHETLLGDEEIRYDESDIDFTVAGFPVIVDLYCDISDTENFQIKMNTSFTDSWYGYTMTFTCDSDSADIKEYSTIFGRMLANSEYIGDTPRFDYIQ